MENYLKFCVLFSKMLRTNKVGFFFAFQVYIYLNYTWQSENYEYIILFEGAIASPNLP